MPPQRLPSDAIPQADNPRILVRAWALVAAGEPCTADELRVHPRQAEYYRAALRILDLLDGDLAPPPARSDEDLPYETVMLLKARFEASACGRAWLEWSGVPRLEDVTPTTAPAFLHECSELAEATLERRAATLARWHEWMTKVAPPARASRPITIPPPLDGVHVDTAPAPYGQYQPRSAPHTRTWEHWTYEDWNERLVEHTFAFPPGERLAAPVSRIPATPEELALVAGASTSNADAIAQAFVKCIVTSLPHGKTSFCGFCRDYGAWTPAAPQAPHFFGMLWFTCLVAYGYPTSDGAFFTRYWGILGKTDNFQSSGRACLPDLWTDVATWTQHRRRVGDAIRQLELPPRDEHRKVIGHSHFLAFPNRRDRRTLSRVLWDAHLVGFEPPLHPVLIALEKNRAQFSADFVEDYSAFADAYAKGEDPRDSAFWRAVRQEALSPSTAAESEPESKTGLVFFAEDDGLHPVIACSLDRGAPAGFEARPLEDDYEWSAYVVGTGEDLEAPWRAAFSSERLLPLGTRRQIAQGVLVLREVASGRFEVASGPAIQGCTTALVMEPLANIFIATFKTSRSRKAPSAIDGWMEVYDCEVRQLDTLPAGLSGATQLLRTMSPPSVSLVGGVRTPGGFLFATGFLPSVRAAGARSVTVVRDGVEYPCPRRDDEWGLPPSVDRPGTYVLRVSWVVPSPHGDVERATETTLSLVERVTNDLYRGKPSGHHFVESCPEPELDVHHVEEVGLGISSTDSGRSADLLDLDATARYLGPGVGEMSLEWREGFDWLVIGPKKKPELLVYVGDPARPTPPAMRRSPRSGDREHWRQSFNAARHVVRDAQGRLRPLTDASTAIRDALSKLRTHQVASGDLCSPTALETLAASPVRSSAPHPRTSEAVDVLVALGARRAGLSYAEIREVFQSLLRDDDPLLLQQVLRAWTEGGLVDSLRNAHSSRLAFVPREPRFVLVRRGLEVDATLVGLVSSIRRKRVERAVASLSGSLQMQLAEVAPSHPWQPSAFRLRGDLDAVEAVRVASELRSSEWLDWPRRDEKPACLDVALARSRHHRSPPPGSYRFDAGWNWNDAGFFRGYRPSDHVHIERRVHVDSSALYVVTRDAEPLLWTHSRAWALLEGYAAHGIAPFKVAQGVLASAGRAPVHLPLPVARLCVLVGSGLPGPVLGHQRQHEYHYPFGPRLYALVERVLPSEWTDHTPSLRSEHAGSHR